MLWLIITVRNRMLQYVRQDTVCVCVLDLNKEVFGLKSYYLYSLLHRA